MSVAQLLLGNEWVDRAHKGFPVLGEAGLLLAAACDHCLHEVSSHVSRGTKYGLLSMDYYGALIVVLTHKLLRASPPTQQGDTSA